MEKFKKKKKYNKGFTITELLVTISIIGILTVISVPSYIQYRTDAAHGALNASLRNIAGAWTACVTANKNSGEEGGCDTWKKIGLNHYDKKSNDEKSGKWTCFGLAHNQGQTELKGCIAMHLEGDREKTVGLKEGGEFLIETKYCYCTKTGETSQLVSPIVTCKNDTGADSCDSTTCESGWDKSCLQHEGTCQTNGRCN